ncbi:hypothetical protein Tco_1394475 [Tanacetum coccineum]
MSVAVYMAYSFLNTAYRFQTYLYGVSSSLDTAYQLSETGTKPHLCIRESIKRVSSNKHEEKSMEFNSLKYDFEWFKHDHLLWKDSMNFANDGGGKEDASNREYGLMINDDDFEQMCDYLLTKDATSLMNDMDERFEGKKFKLIGTPSERIASLDQEFDN